MRAVLGLLSAMFAVGAASAAPVTFVSAIEDASDLGLGLAGAESIIASADGRFVYVSGFSEDAVNVFSRDPVSGALSFVEAERDGVAGVDGLDGARGLSISRDGRFLYATGQVDDAIAVFARDPGNGSLSFVEVQKDNVAGVSGFNGPVSVTTSPDSAHVYVGAFTTVVVFAREPGGGLDFVEAVDAGGLFDSTNAIVASADGKHVYASSFNPGAPRIVVFERDAPTGHLTFVESQDDGVGGVDGLAGVISLLLSPDQRDLYVTGSNDDALAHFERDPATGRLDFVTFLAQDVGGVDGLTNPSGLAMSRDRTRLFTGGNVREIGVFARDTADGTIDYAAVAAFPEESVGDGLLAAGDYLYTAGLAAVAVLSVAELAYVEFQQDGIAGANGLQNPEAIAATPGRRHLLVGSFADDTLTSFEVDPETGALDFADAETQGVGGVTAIDGIYGIAVSPDGDYVYVTSINGGGGLALFTRNAATGALGFVGAQPAGLSSPRILAVSPDGRHVYVPGFANDRVVTYARNPGTGALTLVESDIDGTAGVDGLDGANAVAVAPDGENVYVAGAVADAVAAFSRNPMTGALAFQDAWFDGIGGVDGLAGAAVLAVSPDGRFVYVVGRDESAIATFARDAVTGSLTYLRRIIDGPDDALDGAYSLAFGPGGRTLIVTAATDDAVTVFRRNRATGELFVAQREQNGVDGITSLGGARSVAVVPGIGTYVGSNDLDTITVFAPEPGAGALAAAALVALGSRSRRRSRR